MSGPDYDVIVIGAGSMGSAACYHLARRGARVLGLEQFDQVPHEMGSHGGQSRIIRKAYFEHPGYVPLLEKAYSGWRDLETASGEQLFFKTGLLYCGPGDHEMIKGVLEAARKHSIKLDPVPPGQRASAYPFFNPGADEIMMLEPDAGFLLPGRSIHSFIEQAKNNGAVIKTSCPVLEWKEEKGRIKVITGENIFHAKKLILTAGAWAAKFSDQVKVPLKVTRQVLAWVQPSGPGPFDPGSFPCWMKAGQQGHGVYYGFPYLSGEKFGEPAGLKFALHYPAEETDPDKVNREVNRDELDTLIAGIASFFPGIRSAVVAYKTCLYTNTPDDHFIIDRLPGHDDRVLIACGFCGHGFKFAPVVGEILADLAIKGNAELDLGFLKWDRFR